MNIKAILSQLQVQIPARDEVKITTAKASKFKVINFLRLYQP